MISTFIIAALSADGFIGRTDDEISTSWTSKEDRKYFVDLTKKAGVVIMGSKTYETFGKPLKDRKNIVYSRTKSYPGIEVTSEPPADLIARLEKEGFKEVAICGGASIYTLFLESGLVDKLFLTIEGIIFGQGMPLLDKKMNASLKLLNHTQIAENTIVLEYAVDKKP